MSAMAATEEDETHTWVADAGSADAAARSFARGSVRRTRSRLVLVAVWLLVGALMWTALGDDLDPLDRVLWALGYGTVVLALALPIGLLIGRARVRRLFATRLGPGTELTSRFGPDAVLLTGPLSRHELTYDGLVHVERVDDWVHLRQLGSPVVGVWPADLFPHPELERMRSRVAARR